MISLDQALRQQIRVAIDQAARNRLAATDSIFRTGKCAGCSMEYDDNTPGCETCANRHRGRRRNEYCVDCDTAITRSARTGVCRACYLKRATKAPA